MWKLTTEAGSAADGARVSMLALTVRYGGLTSTWLPAACAFVSGVAMFTFGAGAAGLPLMTDVMKTRSWLSPLSIHRRSPAARPDVLAMRIWVAPAAAAAVRPLPLVPMLDRAPSCEMLPDVSIAR